MAWPKPPARLSGLTEGVTADLAAQGADLGAVQTRLLLRYHGADAAMPVAAGLAEPG